MKVGHASAASPPDVGKGSAFPTMMLSNAEEAPPRALAARQSRAAEQRQRLMERRSLSAHQAAQPREVYCSNEQFVVVVRKDDVLRIDKLRFVGHFDGLERQ